MLLIICQIGTIVITLGTLFILRRTDRIINRTLDNIEKNYEPICAKPRQDVDAMVLEQLEQMRREAQK